MKWPALTFYRNDIWWELYNLYYIKSGDISGIRLEKYIKAIVKPLKQAHSINMRAFSATYTSPNKELSTRLSGVLGNNAYLHTPKRSRADSRYKKSNTKKNKSHNRSKYGLIKRSLYASNLTARKLNEQQRIISKQRNSRTQKIKSKRAEKSRLLQQIANEEMGLSTGGRQYTRKRSRNNIRYT
jgi:hypothetical protein